MFKVRSVFYCFLLGIVLFAFSNQSCSCGFCDFDTPDDESSLVSPSSHQANSNSTTIYVSFSENPNFSGLAASTDDAEAEEDKSRNRSLFLYCLFGIFKQFVEQ